MKQLSLRLRLLIAVGAITLVALGVADVVVYGALRTYLYNQTDATLATSHRMVEATAENPDSANAGSIFVPSRQATNVQPGLNNSSPTAPASGAQLPGPGGDEGASAFCAIGRLSAPETFIEVRTAAGKIVTGAAGEEYCPAFQPGGTESLPKLPAKITGFSHLASDPSELTAYFTTAATASSGPTFRVRASELSNGDILILASPITTIDSALSQLRLLELLVSSLALLGALLLGIWLVQVGLRPLRDVERTAEAISGGDLMHRVPNANRRTEVGHVATAFNVMLERIEVLVNDLRASEGRLRSFVSDASHELRTPLAAVSAYTQLFRKGAIAEDDVARAMSSIERETGRMTRLVEDLLVLARLDEHRPLESEPIELVGLALEAVETARTVSPEWPITFVANDGPVEMLGDHSALRQVVDNLLSNVRAHTPPRTATTLSVRRVDDVAVIEVEDNGPGLSDEEEQRVFERFFRADPSRSRDTGGSGLGLAIVASIVEAHGGQITAAGRPGHGARFLITLPILADADHDAATSLLGNEQEE